MPGPIDDTVKHLTELSPQDWVVQGGWTAAPAMIVDADIATISGATDKVIRVTGQPDWLLAIDFHAGHDAIDLPPRMLLYNAALGKRHRLRVRSLAVVLHPGADSRQLDGIYESGFPGEAADVTLRYRVLRVWQVPAQRWLSGGLGLLPLAPLGAVAEDELPSLITQMKERLDRETTRSEASDLWSATYILVGIRYADAFIETLLQGVMAMEESVTYQKIIRKGEAAGKVQEARQVLLRLGQKRFGSPSSEVAAVVDAIADLSRLEELIERVYEVSSWQELVAS